MDDEGLNLNESCGHVIPDIDQVKNCAADELSEVRIRLETTGKSHQPFCLLLQHIKLKALSDPMKNDKSISRLIVKIHQEKYSEKNI